MSSTGAPLTRRELREAEGRASGAQPSSNRPPSASYRGPDDRPPRRKRRLAWLWILLSLLLVGAVGSYGVWYFFEPQVRKVMGWELPIDFEGTGNGEPVEVVIK